MWLLNRVVNPFVRLLLRSPIHGLLSGRLLLLDVTGRRTGKTFELPVGYTLTGDTLLVNVGFPERKQWWRNVDRETPVTVVLRGEERLGTARRDDLQGGGVRIFIDLAPAG